VINAETGAGGLLAVREAHTATLLKDTALLATGGALTGEGILASAELQQQRSRGHNHVRTATLYITRLPASSNHGKPTTAVRKIGLSPRLLRRKLRNDLYAKTNYALPWIHQALGVYTLNWLLRHVFAAGVASESHP